MKNYVVVAGLLAGAALSPTPLRAEEPAGSPPAASPVPAAPSAPAAAAGPDAPPSPPAAPAAPGDPRDREIAELRALVERLLQRMEQLEARSPAPQPGLPVPPPPPSTTPTVAIPPSQRAAAFRFPNLSVIGDIRFHAGDSRRLASRGRFSSDEIEIAIQDALTPTMRYDLFLAAEAEEDFGVLLEEGYITASALAKGLSGRAGKIFIPIGKLNRQHPDQWVFVTRPSSHVAYLGPEGLSGDGGVLEFLRPLSDRVLARLDVGGWRTVSESEGRFGFKGGRTGAYSARLSFGGEVGQDHELELGFGRYAGRGPVRRMGYQDLAVNSVDLTYRHFPAAYRQTTLQAELLAHQTSGLSGSGRTRLGAYLLGHYRWSQYWDAGARLDYTQFPFPIDGQEYGGSLFLTRHLNEQTLLRLEYQYSQAPGIKGNHAIFLQVLFGSGNHAHVLR